MISSSEMPLPERKHHIHKRQISMPPAGFKVAIPTSEQPQVYLLNREVNGIGFYNYTEVKHQKSFSRFLI
jgi:GMP synthase-like glutamine amidotransferase